MRPDKNVYILGAGFSADAGVPVMAGFLQVARELFDRPTPPLPAATDVHYDAVFKFRERARGSRDFMSLSLDDIETLFSLMDMEDTIARPEERDRPASHIRHLIADTVTRAAHKGPKHKVTVTSSSPVLACENVSAKRHTATDGTDVADVVLSRYQLAAALFTGMLEDHEISRDSVVTLNYDTVLENALLHLGGCPDYCSAALRDSRNAQAWGFPALRVLKLHGSSNWAEVDGGAQVFDTYHDFAEQHAPILVPPTWRKGGLTPLIEDVWQAAHKELATATRVVVIGYSMPPTDTFFHHLMASALIRNPGIYQLHVIDRSDAVAKRYERLFRPLVEYRRFVFHRDGLEGLFLAPSVLHDIGRGSGVLRIDRA